MIYKTCVICSYEIATVIASTKSCPGECREALMRRNQINNNKRRNKGIYMPREAAL